MSGFPLSLVENLRKYPTLAELRKSSFFAQRRQEIDRLLDTPEIVLQPATSPRLRSFLRVTQWNVERGRRFNQVLSTLQSHAGLKWADVILLNEVDFGMLRSGNRHVGRELAQALGMHMVFTPAHIELTKGRGEDLLPPGENQESLQGNAVLTRHPILDARVIRLPACFEPYHFHEKRFGGRNCVWARLQIGSRAWWVGSLHLEVRDTPRCRARQMQYLLSHLPGDNHEPYLIGGDLNCSGFARGTRWRTLVSVWRLTMNSPGKVQQELLHPEWGAEPSFQVARKAGFEWRELNSSDATACTLLDEIEDAEMLPAIVRRLVQKRLEPYEHCLRFKLDWLLGRGVRGLRTGEVHDRATGVASLKPGCVATEITGSQRISDHRPIHADLSF